VSPDFYYFKIISLYEKYSVMFFFQSVSNDSDVIVIEDDEPHRTSIQSDIRHSRLASAGTSISSFRQTSPSSNLSSLGHLGATGGRHQSPISSVHGSSIGGAQTSFMSSNNLASKPSSTSSYLQDSTRTSDKSMAPVISNVESLSGGLGGHSLSSSTKFEDAIMNPLRKTPERQDSFGEGSSMEMSQVGTSMFSYVVLGMNGLGQIPTICK
jgi:hypothetical protein